MREEAAVNCLAGSKIACAPKNCHGENRVEPWEESVIAGSVTEDAIEQIPPSRPNNRQGEEISTNSEPQKGTIFLNPFFFFLLLDMSASVAGV